MTSSLLNIGKTGLLAAQVGLATTGHNIANANVAGYSRQVVQQGAAPAQDAGYGFVGGGTEVVQVQRFYDNFLAGEVRAAQATDSGLQTYYTQISQIDNLLADSTAGLSPALQDFFKSTQDLSANPSSSASRQAVLSSATSLAGRFQSLDARLTEIGDRANAEISSNVDLINSYATQIAKLNDSIANVTGNSDSMPNDMLDQRDQLINELNKYIKTSVVAGSNNRLTVSVGSGQPLVVGSSAFQLVALSAPDQPGRMTVGYQTGSKVTTLPESALSGGALGGLMDFRSNALDHVKNSLGQVALGVALAFNAQHKLGQDQADAAGTDFFRVAPVIVNPDERNNSKAIATAVVTDAGQLTSADYKLSYDGLKFSVARQPGGAPAVLDQAKTVDGVDYMTGVVDGVEYSVMASAAAGDSFTVRPSAAGAAGFDVLVKDSAKIAAAGQLRGAALPATNTGNAKLTEVGNTVNYRPSGPATLPLTLTYHADTKTLSGFPSGDVAYTEGQPISADGIKLVFTGTPHEADSFNIEYNQGGVGDSRNAVALSKLQSAQVLDGASTTFMGSYAKTVSFVGNKTREVEVNAEASAALVKQTEASQQSVSGVNLDEEASNLLRYQQAYQAAGKAMQIAGQLFDIIISLGR